MRPVPLDGIKQMRTDDIGQTRGSKVGRRRQRTGQEEKNPAQMVELVLENVAHGGAVTAHDASGRLYFVRYGLPGERVRAKVTRSQSKFSWADVEAVLEPSPMRISEEHDGAADLGHMSRQGQLSWKSDVLTDQLRRVGGPEVSAQVNSLWQGGVVPVESAPGDSATGPVWGRRTRANFTVAPTGELAVRGYRSHVLIPVNAHPLLDPVFERAGVFTDRKWRGIWRPGDTVTLVAPTGSEPQVVVGERAYSLTGERVDPVTQWTVEVFSSSADFRVASTGFWQTHRAAASLLAERVVSFSGDLSGKKVMELYSGAGLFTYFLSQEAGDRGHIVTLEGSEQAVADAERNLGDMAGGAPVELFVGAVDAEAVAQLAAALQGPPDLVVLDPPRQGAGREVIKAIGGLNCFRVVLVSCDPAAGARDLKFFVEQGFKLTKLEAWDLFPGTHHLEFVARLDR